MNCADAVERLSAALDGELPPADAVEVARHLDACDACARRLRTLQQVRTAVKATAFAPVAGSAFDAGVLERVRLERPATAVRFSPAWLATAAALIVAVSSAIVMLNDRAAPPEPARQVIVPLGLDAAAAVPGWNEGRVMPGADCGLPESGPCIIEGAPALLVAN